MTDKSTSAGAQRSTCKCGHPAGVHTGLKPSVCFMDGCCCEDFELPLPTATETCGNPLNVKPTVPVEWGDGISYRDLMTNREMMFGLVGGEAWLCYKHPDGAWVTERKATPEELTRLVSTGQPEDARAVVAPESALAGEAVERMSAEPAAEANPRRKTAEELPPYCVLVEVSDGDEIAERERFYVRTGKNNSPHYDVWRDKDGMWDGRVDSPVWPEWRYREPAPPTEAAAGHPCGACDGSGDSIIGEYRVTRDMAADAGDLAMEGMFHSYETEPCDVCGGSGIELPAQGSTPASAPRPAPKAELPAENVAALALLKKWRDEGDAEEQRETGDYLSRMFASSVRTEGADEMLFDANLVVRWNARSALNHQGGNKIAGTIYSICAAELEREQRAQNPSPSSEGANEAFEAWRTAEVTPKPVREAIKRLQAVGLRHIADWDTFCSCIFGLIDVVYSRAATEAVAARDTALRELVGRMREVFDEIEGEVAVASTIKGWAESLEALLPAKAEKEDRLAAEAGCAEPNLGGEG